MLYYKCERAEYYRKQYNVAAANNYVLAAGRWHKVLEAHIKGHRCS